MFDILKLKYYNIKILIRTGMESRTPPVHRFLPEDKGLHR
nr:MAG TPA: hypothetical protein [Caudoviricetes sp.]